MFCPLLWFTRLPLSLFRTRPVYGKGPFRVDQTAAANVSACAATEGQHSVGAGVCYFVDSTVRHRTPSQHTVTALQPQAHRHSA